MAGSAVNLEPRQTTQEGTRYAATTLCRTRRHILPQSIEECRARFESGGAAAARRKSLLLPVTEHARQLVADWWHKRWRFKRDETTDKEIEEDRRRARCAVSEAEVLEN